MVGPGATLLLLLLIAIPTAAWAITLLRAWVWLRRLTMPGKPPRTWVERPRLWVPCAVVAVLSAAVGSWAWLIEPDRIEVTRLELATTRPIGGKKRFKIVHLSDLHLERIGERERRVVQAVAAEHPDLIVLTGDYLNHRGAEAELVTLLQQLSAPQGVFGVAGNWDGKFPIPELFSNAGLTLLRDDYRLVAGGDLLIVGLDYIGHRRARDLAAGASDKSYKLLLHHSPDAVDELRGAPFDLFLCGHTHGGQVRLPFYGALVTMAETGKRYEMGRYFIPPGESGNPAGTGMYVNRGIGMSGFGPPVRFWCRPEVAVIELVVP
jgi:hypothetical protein